MLILCVYSRVNFLIARVVFASRAFLFSIFLRIVYEFWLMCFGWRLAGGFLEWLCEIVVFLSCDFCLRSA